MGLVNPAPTYRCLNCGRIPRWGHVNEIYRYVPGSWSCNDSKCQKDPFWKDSGFNYNDWYSKAYQEAYRLKYGEDEFKNGVSEES